MHRFYQALDARQQDVTARKTSKITRLVSELKTYLLVDLKREFQICRSTTENQITYLFLQK